MILKTGHIILFLLFCDCFFINAQTVTSKINPDNLNINLLESLIKNNIDSVRLKNKCKILAANDTLQKAADDQAEYMKKKKSLTHYQDKSEKKEVDDRCEYYGLKKSGIGENIAYTYIFTNINNGKKGTYINTTYGETANDFVRLWVNSKGHFENLTNADYNYTAVAVSYDKKFKRLYAVQVFSTE